MASRQRRDAITTVNPDVGEPVRSILNAAFSDLHPCHFRIELKTKKRPHAKIYPPPDTPSHRLHRVNLACHSFQPESPGRQAGPAREDSEPVHVPWRTGLGSGRIRGR